MLNRRNSAVNFLDETAAKFASKTAMENGESKVTFGELRETSAKIGTYLINSGYSGKNVAVLLPKSISAAESFFGILYAAGVYVPLDLGDAYPRIETILKNVDAAAVLTDSEHIEFLSGCGIPVLDFDDISSGNADYEKISAANAAVTDMDPAYIMHTSGSTGVPKGVVVSHRGIIDFIEWITGYMKLDETSVIALQSPFNFDASVFDLYSCIAVGAKLSFMPDILMNFPAKIPQFLVDNKISCVFWVPGILVSIANSGALEGIEFPDLKVVSFIGETMPTRHYNIWKKLHGDITYINLYGPTEATVACTAYTIGRDFQDNEALPIGYANDNKRMILLDENGKAPKPFDLGEICIGGSGVAFGYYNDSEKSDKVFVQNPLNDKYTEIIYRTGDYGYFDNDGNLYFSGRRDNQVKLHGIRVELGDIENAACSVETVEKACAFVVSEKLILYIQAKELPNRRKFNLELRKYIPKYMLPSEIISVPKFPLNKNGKIDRKKLLNGEY